MSGPLGYVAFMSTNAECPVCERRVGIRPKGQGFVMRWHRHDGAPCHGSGQSVEPMEASAKEAQPSTHPGARPSWEHAMEVYEKTAVGRRGRRLAPTTLKKYRPALRRFSAFCRHHGAESPPDVSVELLRQFHGEIVGSNPSAPAAQAVAAVRSFMRWALEWWSDALPSALKVARACPTVATEQAPHRTLANEEFERVMAYLRNLTSEPLSPGDGAQVAALRDASALVLAVCAGLRRAEIAHLRLCDIDPGASESYWVLHVLGKGNKRRLAVLDGTAAAVVERYVKATLRELDRSSTESVLLPSRVRGDRSRMLPRSVYEAVIRFQRAAGITPVPTHGLRSTFGLRFLKSSSGDLQALQHLFGHASATTTMRYAAHVTMDRVSGHVPSVG